MRLSKSIMTFCLLLPALMSCKSRSPQNKLKADIRELDQSVRVIYRDGNTVFLVTCPLEKGEVNDHIDDEKVLGRAACNDKNAPNGADGKPQVQTLAFVDYESKLKQAVGIQGPSNKAEIDAVKAKIAEQQRKLDKIVASGLNTNANSGLVEKQAAKANKNLEDLKAQLGTGTDAETKIELFNTLITYLNINSQAAFNIAQSEAGQLLAPFGGAVAGASAVAGRCSQPNSLGMVFCEISKGTFTMGSPENESGRNDDEVQHQVTLSKDFEMMSTEVTRGMWALVCRGECKAGDDPSKFKDDLANPIERVSWNDITNEFLPKLNAKLSGDGYTYRLPSEAEWEYAARGEKAGPFGIEGDPKDFGWFQGNSGGKTSPVGKLKSNKYGLFDMHGNVGEWVQDGYADYAPAPITDPIVKVSPESFRVFRGGKWDTSARNLRSAARDVANPAVRGAVVGFRLVRTR